MDNRNNYNSLFEGMTAMDWLKEKLKQTYSIERRLPIAYTLHLIKQAKELEKAQIIKAHGDQYDGEVDEIRTGERYYNDTYGSSEKA